MILGMVFVKYKISKPNLTNFNKDNPKNHNCCRNPSMFWRFFLEKQNAQNKNKKYLKPFNCHR